MYIEDKMQAKFLELQYAREHRNEPGADVAFDELQNTIEMDIGKNDEYQKIKNEIIENYHNEMKKVERKVAQEPEPDRKERIWNIGLSTAQWEARGFMEAALFQIVKNKELVNPLPEKPQKPDIDRPWPVPKEESILTIDTATDIRKKRERQLYFDIVNKPSKPGLFTLDFDDGHWDLLQFERYCIKTNQLASLPSVLKYKETRIMSKGKGYLRNE